jgi:hypothetical protein
VASAATRNAATCSAADVQTAINSSLAGDTVVVPPGSCNWGATAVSLSGKNITLQGAGIGNTVITSTGTTLTWGTSSARVTGFSFTVALFTLGGDGWRIDHNIITGNGSRTDSVVTTCSTVAASGYCSGLIDNNVFSAGARIVVAPFAVSTDQGNQIWNDATALGGSRAVFVEDNDFQSVGADEPIDANYSSRYVFRFNTYNNATVHTHSLQQYRGSRMWEIYKNTATGVTGAWVPIWLRGGTGVIWGNTLAGSWSSPAVMFDNVRSFSSGYSYGVCDGTSTADGNTSGQSGWPCRDQIGRGRDLCLSAIPWSRQTSSEAGWCAQSSEPAYLWLNRAPNGGTMSVDNDHNGTGAWIQPNRDFYNEASSFTGTAGVGVGPVANRPSTCTTGVGYWATDEGKWNSRNAGPDGRLYKCVETNTWTLYYTPYTYPHPMQTGGPAPPSALTSVVQ